MTRNVRNLLIVLGSAGALALAACGGGFSCTDKNPCTGAAPTQAEIDDCNTILKGACGSQYKDLGNCLEDHANTTTCAADGGLEAACQTQVGNFLGCCFSDFSACSSSSDSSDSFDGGN